MFKILPQTSESKDYELEFYNPMGLLFKNHIFLKDDNRILEFDTQEIKRLFLKKERNLKLNYLSLTVSCFLVVFTFFQNDLATNKYISFGLASLFLIFALVKKMYDFK
ncbi:MAG: hypothetical protein H7239_00545 [Flavobacterium sp.]|nr:hypothetical protein [Flavobacterium sp.]